MIFNEKTLSLLKNFSQINQGIIFSTDNMLRTVSINQIIFSFCPIQEEFKKKFAIYDLNEFLSTLSLFQEREIELKDEYLLIKDLNSKSKVKYFYSSESIIVAPKKLNVQLPSKEISFELKKNDLDRLVKSASAMKLKNFEVTKHGIGARNEENVGNLFEMDLEIERLEEIDDDFSFKILIENLKFIPGDYVVTVSKKGVTEFRYKGDEYNGLVYYVALNAKSNNV